MKVLKASLLLFFCMAFFACRSFAQFGGVKPSSDPTDWSYEVKKISSTEYKLIFHLSLQKGWHVWSLHPGGDGLEIAPSFKLDENEKVQVLDSVAEQGTPVTTNIEGIDGKITYFTDRVDYILKVHVTGNTKITGTHEYQVCSNAICLPPKRRAFTFEVKN